MAARFSSIAAVTRLGSAFAALALVAAFAAPPAWAGFAPDNEPVVEAEQLSATGLAMDASGNSIVAWNEEDPVSEADVIKARRVAANGDLGPVIDVAPGEDGLRPAVAVTPGGRAFVAWRSRVGEPFDPDGVKGRWIEPDGTLGPLLTIVEPVPGDVSALDVKVAIDSAGVASVVWRDEADNVLELRRVQPDGTLGPLLDDISGSGVLNPQIAALPNGSSVVVWRGLGTEKNVISAANVVGIPEEISVLHSTTTTTPALAFDALGNGYAVWTLQEGGESYSVRGRRLDASGAAVGGELIIDPPAKPFLPPAVSISAASEGRFVVGWARRPSLVEEDYVANVRALDGTGEFLSPVQPISVLPGSAGNVRTGVFDNGSVAAAWGSSSGTDDATLGRELGLPGLSGGPIQSLLGESGPESAANAPAIGAAAFLLEYPVSGSAHAAVLRRFLVPPTCVDGVAVATADSPLAVPAECTGAGIESAAILSGPRFGAVGNYDPATGSLTYTPRGNVRNDSFTYAALNDGGSSNPVTVTIRDRVRPQIKSLRVLRSKKRPRVFKFRLVFSEPAKPRIVVQRRLPGILKGKRCVKPRNRAQLKTRTRCLRFHRVGVVQKRGLSRRWTIRAPRGIMRQLRHGGGFRVVARGADRAGNRSPAKRINIRT